MKEMHKDIINVRASASLPLVSRIVMIDGKPYLDGGIADPIPIRHAIKDGNAKNIVILTKETDYVRKPAPSAQLEMIRLRYTNYPKLYELMANRHNAYNDTLRFIEGQKAHGRAFVIRPKEANDIGRIEKDRKKLEKLYELGYEDAKACYEDMMKFLNA